MLSQKSTMKDKLENMHLQERINYGYGKVISMMLISGLFSIVVIGVLFANMLHYIDDVNAAISLSISTAALPEPSPAFWSKAYLF